MMQVDAWLKGGGQVDDTGGCMAGGLRQGDDAGGCKAGGWGTR